MEGSSSAAHDAATLHAHDRPSPDSILRHRPFVLFWFARVCATIGYQMLVVAIGWQLYELTGNPLDLGLVGLVQFIPAIAAGAGDRPGDRPL